MAVKYPIVTETYIAAMRLTFGPDEAAEEAHRVIIPLANNAYKAGLKGKGGFPLVLDEVRRAYVEAYPVPLEGIQANLIITGMVQWVNQAYAQGCKDAERQRRKETV